MSDRQPTAPGRIVAERYRLESRLGSGAMGTVWLGTDEVLGRRVAVKEILSPPGASVSAVADQRARALREGRIAARLDDPHAIALYDVALDGDEPWLVMEYLPSRDLAELVRDRHVLPVTEVAQVGAQVAGAMAAAHAVGIVHRDIKPGNVLVGEGPYVDGLVKITDFGISHADGDVEITRAGTISGTPAYFAPDVARGAEPSPASDVFSLGATLYTCLEGAPPFGLDDNTLALMVRVADGVIVPPVRAGALEPVLLWMLRADPAGRPTMAEARDALAEVAAGRPGAVTEVLAARTRLSPVPLAAAVLAVGAAGVAGVAALGDGDPAGGGAVAPGAAPPDGGAGPAAGGAGPVGADPVAGGVGPAGGGGAGPVVGADPVAGGVGPAVGVGPAAGGAGPVAGGVGPLAGAAGPAAGSGAAAGAAAGPAGAVAAGGAAAGAAAPAGGAVAAAAQAGWLAALLAKPALTAAGIGAALLAAGGAYLATNPPAAPAPGAAASTSQPATPAVTTPLTTPPAAPSPTVPVAPVAAGPSAADAERAVRALLERLFADPAGALSTAGPALQAVGPAAVDAYAAGVRAVDATTVRAGDDGTVVIDLRITRTDGGTRTEQVAFAVTPALLVDSEQLAALLAAGPPLPVTGLPTTAPTPTPPPTPTPTTAEQPTAPPTTTSATPTPTPTAAAATTAATGSTPVAPA